MERSVRAAATRRRILDAASELFYARGINAVGVDEIVARSGIAKMTLYKHFASKDALAGAYLARRDQLFRETFRKDVERRAGDPAGRLLACFDVLEEMCKTPTFRGCPFQNAASELASPEHPARQVCKDHKAQLLGYLTELCEDLRSPRPRELAEQWLLLIDGALVSALVWGSPAPARRAKQVAKAMLDQ